MRCAPLAITLLATLGLSLGSTANAQSVHALDGSHELLSENYNGRVLFVEYTNRSDRVQRATVVRLNDYFGLTAAHVAAAFKPGTSPLVGTGTDYHTIQGETRNLSDWGTHPTWNGTFNGTAIDLAWVRFDQPLPGPTGFETEAIAAIGLDTDVTFVGYGRPATPGQGLLGVDGERRAFTGITDEQGSLQFGISTDYSKLDFYALNIRNEPLAGVATAGNSGSPGFRDDGRLALLVAATAGSPDYSSSTFALRLSRYRTWIEENTTPPAPCTPDLNGDGIVDNGDIGTFVNLFLAGDLAADFNGDGILDNGDIGAFVTVFLAGC